MNIKLSSLLKEQQKNVGRATIAGISFNVSGHENRLYLIPETSEDLVLIQNKGGTSFFVQTEAFPFLESSTGVKWTWDENNPGTGLIFEIDLKYIINKIME